MSVDKLVWFYDFISPFAYLQSTRLDEFSKQHTLDCHALLFAGLLDHWSNVGPAEIVPKRNWTFEHVTWLAHRDNIPFKLPASHPFNPLPLLRMAIALDNRIDVIQRIFRWVWVEGQIPQNDPALTALLAEYKLSLDDINTATVKAQLRENGERAIAAGVFGVPTFLSGKQIFWGYDASDMVQDYLRRHTQPEAWPAADLKRVETFPQGPGRQRRQS